MKIRPHPHARAPLKERGATEQGIVATVEGGERIAARFSRVAFRRNFAYNASWQGRSYATKQVEAIAVEEEGWLVITAIVRYY